jgi:hypothetical protein
LHGDAKTLAFVVFYYQRLRIDGRIRHLEDFERMYDARKTAA